MPVIEFDHVKRQYHVYVARTVEWGTGKHANSYNHAVPFAGIAEIGGLDTAQHFVYGENAMSQALDKMAELWVEWKEKEFKGVIHA